MIDLTSNQKRAIAFFVVLIHALLLISIPAQAEPPKRKGPPTLSLQALTELIDRDEREGKGDIRLNCPRTYDGIGIQLDYAGRINHVARGWPADRAGIRAGDQIVGGPFAMERTDGFRAFEVLRDGRKVRMTLSTAAICFRDGPIL